MYGIDHLVGETGDILADGKVHPPQIVSNWGIAPGLYTGRLTWDMRPVRSRWGCRMEAV